ncbi:hypothetical protein ACRARG_16750 [Pseudooceanicola sp. C21-150M6]|uniref:DUF4177 domain-containing protein n=1 Tax=Pseudooceanicola sp. C21-150M6 TaxID=3434355 RepID=UPI003D7F7A73
MNWYEYKVVPAPTKGTRARAARTADSRFALTLETVMNSMAADGWEFLRAETLPSEERSGLTQSQTVYRSMLIFRRQKPGGLSDFAPRVLGETDQTALLPAPEETTAGEAQTPEDAASPANAIRPASHSLTDLLRRRANRLFSAGEAQNGVASPGQDDTAPDGPDPAMPDIPPDAAEAGAPLQTDTTEDEAQPGATAFNPLRDGAGPADWNDTIYAEDDPEDYTEDDPQGADMTEIARDFLPNGSAGSRRNGSSPAAD